MPTDIVQKLGFDTSDAIANLDRLGAAISKVSGRITRFGKNLERFNSQANGSFDSFARGGDAAARLGQEFDRVNTTASRLTTSVELLSRIVYTQLVIKGLRVAETALFDATKRASELQLKLAEISTVAEKGTFSGIADISDSVKTVAKDLGIPQLQVAENLYTTIQNQIGGTKQELIDFNRVAGQFAISTLTDQASSLELLSGTLNAYQLDVTRTEEIASKFNKTIELGNIEGSELAHTFGRVASRASSLGLSLEETLGLIQTLTVRGVNPNEAATQIGALITAFTKPSDAMKAALQGLNAPSGEFLVRMNGITQALKLVIGQTDGSSAAIARLFPNVRAVNGVAITASDNFERLAENIQKTRETAISLNKERFDVIDATDARKVTRELENVRTAMDEMGEALLKTTAKGLDFVDGAEGIIQVLKTAFPVIVGYTTQFAALNLQAGLAAGAYGAAGASIAGFVGKLGSLALIGGIATSAVNLGIDKLVDDSLSGVQRIEAAREQALSQFKADEAERLKAAREVNEDIIKSMLASSQGALDAFNATRNSLVLQENTLVTATKQSLNRVVKFRTDLLRQVEQAVSDSAKHIEQSQRRVVDLRFEQGQNRFDRQTNGLSDPDKFNRLLNRSRQLAQQASSSLSNAVSDNQISQALKLFDVSQKSAEQAKSIADRIGKRDLENRAMATLNRLTEQQISAEKRLQQTQVSQSEIHQQDLDEQRRITDEVKAQAKIITDNLTTVQKTPQEAAKSQGIVRDALSKLTKAGLSGKDVSLAQSLGLTQLASDIQRNMGGEVKLQFNTTQSIQDLQDKLTTSFNKFKIGLNFDVGNLEKTLGVEVRSVDDLNKALSDAMTKSDKLRTEISQVRQTQKAATLGVRAEIRELLSASDSFINATQRTTTLSPSFTGEPSLNSKELTQSIAIMEQFRSQAQKLSTQDQITRKDVQDLFNVLSNLNDVSKGQFKLDIGNFSKVIELFNGIEQSGKASTEAQERRLQELQQLINGVDSAGVRIENGFQSAAATLKEAADYVAERFSQLGSLVTPQYSATGGLARGTDTVPAMLSPGEVVMNRDASQRFYSDLQRMNAGMTPQYRSSGGSVTNVGDVSITVNESATPRQTAAEIESMLLRRQRRGISRLNK